ncbi:hypothetical protein M569_11616, partial [Genlisea aurea]
RSRNRFRKTLGKVINLKSNQGFCLLIPPEKLRCCESRRFESDDKSEEEERSRAAIAAFAAKVFASISAVKAAYAELQLAQFPHDADAVRSADQAVVDELKLLSELKQSFLKKRIDSSPAHVTAMLAEIQEQQSLLRTYEITMRKMRSEIDGRNGRISDLRDRTQQIAETNRELEERLEASGRTGSIFPPDGVHCKDFIFFLQYCLESVRSFVKLLIREMESAGWDIQSAANAIQPDTVFWKSDHLPFAFESFVGGEIFSGLREEETRRGGSLLEEFKDLSSIPAIQFLKQNPNSSFGKFLRSRYLDLIHPDMEFSFSGNVNQRETVDAGGAPETEFFEAFSEMGRRAWLLNCLVFFSDGEIGAFRVKRSARFSDVYMRSVTEEVFAAVHEGRRVAFTVVPGFRFGATVVQSQVYL